MDDQQQTAVIERMRKVNTEEAGSLRARGAAVGEKWARERARPRYLELLRTYFTHIGKGTAVEFAKFAREGETSHVAVLAMLMLVRESMSREAVLEFWRDVLGEQEGFGGIVNRHFAEGFVAAALAVWEQVRGKI